MIKPSARSLIALPLSSSSFDQLIYIRELCLCFAHNHMDAQTIIKVRLLTACSCMVFCGLLIFLLGHINNITMLGA